MIPNCSSLFCVRWMFIAWGTPSEFFFVIIRIREVAVA
ncbi:unnamed protein product [Larinioides sclopetarius]|uniref:Uncharacterized protein n=1 Tax=Larinioides sclopetarius TaxID=280406 RepID=A0AAV1ZHV5_9ARAC